MKNRYYRLLSLTIFMISLFLFSNSIYAQTPTSKPTTASVTPPASPAATITDVIDKLKQIKILKEKIATKVAELREKEKGALFGTVKKIDKSSLVVTTKSGDKTLLSSDDTLYFLSEKGKKTGITRAKLFEKSTVSVFGYYNGDKTTLSAKYIYLQTPPIHLIGKIIDKDAENFTITVKEKQNQIIVDIETYTRTFIFSLNKNEFARSGFSKLKLADSVQIIGTANEKEEGRISTNRIYALSPTGPSEPVTISPTKAKDSTSLATPTKSGKISSTITKTH